MSFFRPIGQILFLFPCLIVWVDLHIGHLILYIILPFCNSLIYHKGNIYYAFNNFYPAI